MRIVPYPWVGFAIRGVFYDLDEAIQVVHVRATRCKLPHQTTGQIV